MSVAVRYAYPSRRDQRVLNEQVVHDLMWIGDCNGECCDDDDWDDSDDGWRRWRYKRFSRDSWSSAADARADLLAARGETPLWGPEIDAELSAQSLEQVSA